MILPFCIFSWGWSWSLPSVQCHKPPSIVLQAFCLLDLIPWIYLSLPLYNHKGFDLGHTWTIWWYLSVFTKLFLCIQFTWKGKKLMISKVSHYPDATLGFSIFCGQDLFLQIPWNMNHILVAEKKHSWKYFISAMASRLPLQSLWNLMGLWGQDGERLSASLTWDNSNNSKNAFVLLQQLSSKRLTFSSKQQHLYGHESL